MSPGQQRVWDLRETPEDLAVKQQVQKLVRDLLRSEKKVRRVYAACLALSSYQEAEEMSKAGLEDPPTVGFNLAGALEGAIEDLDQMVARLKQAAVETVADLLSERRSGTADLGRFRR
jgi:hypothetical protein